MMLWGNCLRAPQQCICPEWPSIWLLLPLLHVRLWLPDVCIHCINLSAFGDSVLHDSCVYMCMHVKRPGLHRCVLTLIQDFISYNISLWLQNSKCTVLLPLKKRFHEHSLCGSCGDCMSSAMSTRNCSKQFLLMQPYRISQLLIIPCPMDQVGSWGILSLAVWCSCDLMVNWG